MRIRHQITNLEQAQAIRDLLKAGWTVGEILRLLRISRRTYYRRLRIFPPPAQQSA